MKYDIRELEGFLARFYNNRPLLITPYQYNVIFAALAQNATQVQPLSISANADFCLMALSFRAQIGAAQTINTSTAPFVRVLITDTGSNERFTDSPVDLCNYASNVVEHRLLPYPRMISGRSALQVQATNYAPTAETYTTIDLSFVGALVRAYADA